MTQLICEGVVIISGTHDSAGMSGGRYYIRYS